MEEKYSKTKPDYEGGSIINLMATIEKALGGNPKYKTLKQLPPSILEKYDNIVLLVLDGLGYDYVKKQKSQDILKTNLKGKITTVFPSTTPCAIASFLNGTPPSEHGILGLFSYIPEINETIVTIRHGVRGNGPLPKKVKFQELYNLTPFSDKIKCKAYHLDDEKVTESDYTTLQAGKSKIIGYKDNKDCFKKIEKIIRTEEGKKYFYVHIPDHDLLCHDFGLKSKEVLNNYKKTNLELNKFLIKIKNTNTVILVTADHGMIDCPKENMILVKDYPDIQQALKNNMYGQSRYANCIVKDKKKFKEIISKRFNEKCEILEKKDFLKLYGPKMSKRFQKRLGDFLLIMKKNYGIYDLPKNQSYETYDYNTSDHGGLTSQEMHVPLIIIKSK